MQYFKFTTLLIFVLFASHTSAQSLRKLLEIPDRVIESKWEQDTQGATELNYYNADFCDYYLFRESDRSYNLTCGKNTIFRIEKDSKAENPFKNSSRYMFFRGQFPKDFQISTPYAFPVKDGQKIEWQIDLREQSKTMNFRANQGDTIYATRKGIACTTAHPQQVLIYHPDCTFAAYLQLQENFIYPGQEVQTGQPIGTAGAIGLPISYFFLDKNKFTTHAPTGYPFSHFTPVFRTDKGDIKPEEKTLYQAVVNDDLITREMNKRETKKYLKQKNSK